MGGMMTGADPASSVTDGYGRVHGLDNVYVADGSVFVTSGAHNPTNTIMAVALRNTRHQAGPAEARALDRGRRPAADCHRTGGGVCSDSRARKRSRAARASQL